MQLHIHGIESGPAQVVRVFELSAGVSRSVEQFVCLRALAGVRGGDSSAKQQRTLNRQVRWSSRLRVEQLSSTRGEVSGEVRITGAQQDVRYRPGARRHRDRITQQVG